MNIIQIFNTFPTEGSCVKYFEQIKWVDKPICPSCGSTNTNPLTKKLSPYCNSCHKSFSVKSEYYFSSYSILD